jgi:hypothetical protein
MDVDLTSLVKSQRDLCSKEGLGLYQPSSASSRGVSAWTIYPTVNFQVDGGIKGWDLGLDPGKEGFVEVERKPPAEQRLFVVQPSLAVTEFISISTKNYSSAVVRSEASGTVTSTYNSWGSRDGKQEVFRNAKMMQPSCKASKFRWNLLLP